MRATEHADVVEPALDDAGEQVGVRVRVGDRVGVRDRVWVRALLTLTLTLALTWMTRESR